LLLAGSFFFSCTHRQRTGPEGNNGNGGVLEPDSTTRDDTTVQKRAIDTLNKKSDKQ
jgi:hypothetical protein